MTPIVEQQLQQGLSELNGKVDRLTAALIGSDYGEGRIPRLEESVNNIDERVKALEIFHWKTAGAMALLLALFEAGIHLLKH